MPPKPSASPRVGDPLVFARRAARASMRAWDRGLRRVTSPLRLLPSFVVIGAQKAGTTSLYHYLGFHPNIALSDQKEVHFFDLNFERGTGWYRSRFPTFVADTLHQRRTGSSFKVGESSPYYLFHPHTPARLRELLPEARLIALLRNPADRAISHYQHERRKGREPLSLEQAIASEETRLAPELERIERDPSFRGYEHRRHSYLARGRYAEQFERWHRYFPREQILVLKSEDFFRDPASVYQTVLRFLEVPEWEPPAFPRFNEGRYTMADQVMRKRLIAYFEPHNRRLYDLLERNFGWEDPG
jgi:hypothetical protein